VGDVARSALLRSLFTSWAAGSDSSFLAAARSIIDEERRKGHRLLAGELEDALNDPRRPGAREPLSMRPVPKGRDERPLLSLTKARWTFADLAYSADAAAELRDLVEENERRTLLVTHAMRPRQRVLLVGPSGAGKTAAAHAIAAQLSLPVASANLAALTSSYLGETARNIESVVRFAETTPCVLVLDEFDALASERALPGDHGELRRVVATVLQVLEDVRGESLVVATSNHPQMLDSAVWRRFDEVIRLTHPARDTIHTLLRLRLSDRAGTLDLEAWSERLQGSSAAEVELISMDALRHSILDERSQVSDAHLEAAILRLNARKSAVRAAEAQNYPDGAVMS
jgi:SpoVK/Ycf46/Vps4 family AAA+-type ATPase